MAAIIGATFMKFGRAPTTVSTFMTSRDLSVRHGISGLQQHHNLLDDAVERSSIAPPGLSRTLPPDESQLRRHIRDALEEDEPARPAEVLVDCADPSSEGAV